MLHRAGALARELNRAGQELRKQARLTYTDRVTIGVVGASAAVDAMLAEHGAWLGEQALATVTRSALARPLGAAVLTLDDAAAGASIEASIEVSIARA